jgi:mono/diheme cytochrome c family protein
MPEAGGWNPADIKVAAGKPLTLRLTSADVMHGFAVGRLDIPAVDIYPGEVTEIELVFDEPGTYTYYCTRWCGANHWRMRGTIEVTGGDKLDPTAEQPLYLQLALDLDAPHPAETIPAGRPDASHGAKYLVRVPELLNEGDYLRSQSPSAIWASLRKEPALAHLDEASLWNVVAALWQKQTTEEKLALGAELYTANCAACHGENGQGDGVFAIEKPAEMPGMDMTEITGHEIVPPSDFTDPTQMLGASPAILQGKIVRGGMGTGMPYWGPIFTSEQTWALVDFLWTFQFDYEKEVKP